jgi:hypothetical protein
MPRPYRGVLTDGTTSLTTFPPWCYNATMHNGATPTPAYPLPIALALHDAEWACSGDADRAECHDAALWLTSVLTCYLGAVAVGQYSQALYTDQIEADPTLNRSLRSLRRVMPGQWLLWAARGLAATPDGLVAGLSEWYARPEPGALAEAYTTVRDVMVTHMEYGGEYGPRVEVSPRLFLELVDQYRVRGSKVPGDTLPTEALAQVAGAVLGGARILLEGATCLAQYPLYAPQQRRLLTGLEATTPMPPLHAPEGAAEAATLLLYPPGETPDYTKRPTLQAERLPLFPLDPLLAYLYCRECDAYQVAALREVANDTPTYQGLDPQCRHTIGV